MNDERQPAAVGDGRASILHPPSSILHPRSPACWVAMLLLGVYLLTTGGQPFISDGEVMFITTTRIVDEHTLTLPTGAAVYPQVLRRQDGYLFSRYGLGQPLAAAPLYALGRYLLAVWLWRS